MTKYFIAKAVKGNEYLFDRRSMIAVPTTTAQRICDALNQGKWKLAKDQVWHVFENDYYYNPQINYEIKQFGKRIKIHRRCA